MGNTFSTVKWESPTGGKFRIYSRFYDVYGLGNWKPVEVEERIVGHPAFERGKLSYAHIHVVILMVTSDQVGQCLVMVELKSNGTHEIEFRKQRAWKDKQVRFLDCALDGLPAPYHWWGLVIIRPHLRIAKEAADKIASATGRSVIISAQDPLSEIVQEKQIVKKKVTIAEEPQKKAASSGDKETEVEGKKVEMIVEETTTTVEKQPEVEAIAAGSEGSKKSQKKGKPLPEV
uniref:Uncharacterized protein n=1 Tax=Kwoniella pini CBS 10737 TaxID=1296096 RepID=A0A1B9I9I5_9TREE|nr:uncharacterized protein I206_01418 [Kwoniella pini CBS 10737]OCF52133.1 hypothetical protein I206_01418 [Kwoniella pini CBS 10737]